MDAPPPGRASIRVEPQNATGTWGGGQTTQSSDCRQPATVVVAGRPHAARGIRTPPFVARRKDAWLGGTGAGDCHTGVDTLARITLR